MKSSFVFELIRLLSAEERQELELFVASPYFNRGKSAGELAALLHLILNALNQTEALPPEKKELYQKIFPGTPWVEGKLDKLLVELKKLLRTFLLTRQYFQADNEFQAELDWGKVLRGKGLESHYQRSLEQLKPAGSAGQWKTAPHYLRRLQLEHAIHEQQSYDNRKKGDLNIPAVLHNLDMFYHLYRLEHLNYFLLQCKMTNLDISDDIALALRESPLPERYLEESSYLLIQYKIFCLLQSPNPSLAEFEALNDLLKRHEPFLEKNMLEQYYAYLRNICVILIASGAEDLYPILHQIQRDNLERGILYLEGKQGRLSPSAVLNLVTNGLIVRNYGWVAEFLESHKDRILGDNATQDLYRTNMACYLFAVGKFEEALDYIPQVSPYVDYHLMARRLELRIYYELNSDLLPYKIDAFRMYLSRSSHKFLSPALRERNGDFANLLFQLSHVQPGNPERARRVLRRIEQNKGVSERKWLLEKARQLLGD
ncbi:MAG: hypothetical protein L6Q97_19445 [Thermoanaerobaculia bacterium]|nr:hypothetical protein [Thermoanaerobaculia bacterium]